MQLVMSLQKGVAGRIIFDEKNFYASSCARQSPRVHELFQAGCEIRLCKPSAGCFSCMHAKTWLFDEQVLYTGSPNLTHNGMENNVENLWRVTTPSAVQDYVTFFDGIWSNRNLMSKTIVVGEEEIDRMMKEYELRNDKKVNRSKSRSMSRSLSKELDEEA